MFISFFNHYFLVFFFPKVTFFSQLLYTYLQCVIGIPIIVFRITIFLVGFSKFLVAIGIQMHQIIIVFSTPSFLLISTTTYISYIPSPYISQIALLSPLFLFSYFFFQPSPKNRNTLTNSFLQVAN